jgi:hypothetical protein
MVRRITREAQAERTARIEAVVMVGLAITVPLATSVMMVWKLFDY